MDDYFSKAECCPGRQEADALGRCTDVELAAHCCSYLPDKNSSFPPWHVSKVGGESLSTDAWPQQTGMDLGRLCLELASALELAAAVGTASFCIFAHDFQC